MFSGQFFLASAFIVLLLNPQVIAQKVENGEFPAAKAESSTSTVMYLLNGIKAGREQLRSGIASINGHYLHLDSPTINQRLLKDNSAGLKARLSAEQYQGFERSVSTPKPLPPDFDITCTFDFDHDRIRFDRKEGILESHYLRIPEFAIVEVLTNGNSTGTIDKLPHEKHPGMSVRPIDVRDIGLYCFGDFERSNGGTSLDDFAIHQELWRTMRIDSVQTEDGVYSVTFSRPGDRLIHKLRVDSHQGMVPVAVSHWEGANELFDTETKWTDISKVTLPTECSLTDYQSGRILQLEINWKKVNEDVPDEIFKMDAMSPPAGTLVVDHRLEEKPIVESIIGESGKLVTVPADSWTLRRIALILNVVLVILIISLIVYRRRNTAQPST